MEHNYTSSLTGISRGRFGKLHILRAGSYQDINAVLDAFGSTDLSDYVTNSALTTALSTKLDALTGGGAVVISGSGTSRTITVDLSGYYTASQVGILLSGKVSSVTAGTGITLGGTSTAPVINAAQQLSYKMDGVTQSGVDTIDFLAHTFSLNSGTLTVGPPDFQSRLSLIWASSADKMDLTRDVVGNLVWNGGVLATRAWANTQLTGKLNTTGVREIAWTNDVDTKTLSMHDDQSLSWGSNTLLTDADLSLYSETAGSQTTVLQSFDTATPVSTHISWNAVAIATSNTTGSHQTITQSATAGNYHVLSNTTLNGPAGGTIMLQVYVRAGTANGTIIAVNNGATWTGYEELVLTGLSSSSFTLVTWSFTVPSSGAFNFPIG